MKKLIITGTLLLFLGVSSIYSTESNLGKNKTLNIGTVKSMFLPFSTYGKAEMELVYTKGKYSLWRCKDEFVDNYPSNSLTGKKYKYFVYKNNSYHLAIKENNKQDIYKYFAGFEVKE